MGKNRMLLLPDVFRINEHKAAVKHARTEVSAVAEHVWQEASNGLPENLYSCP